MSKKLSKKVSYNDKKNYKVLPNIVLHMIHSFQIHGSEVYVA